MNYTDPRFIYVDEEIDNKTFYDVWSKYYDDLEVEQSSEQFKERIKKQRIHNYFKSL